MRRKGNLSERIENAKDYLITYEGSFSNVNDFIKDKQYLNFKEIFNNDNQVELDIGCGLGGFLVEIAKNNPDVNYIGIEKYSNIIIAAIDKAREYNLKNVKFINCRVECIEKYFKDDSIANIYLNFSNPLPNKTDEKKRLTNPRYLKIYNKILVNNGLIIQKTDDRTFFDYSIENFKNFGYVLKNITYDLKNNPVKDNILTEHEIKYMKEGKLINRLEVINVK